MIFINEKPVNTSNFPDGTALIKYSPYKEMQPNMSATIKWLYDNDAELFDLICLTKHLRAHGFNNINLTLPYVPHARMDRVKDAEDVFTLKYFTDVINSLEFNTVTVFDPHSNVCTALINNVRVIEATTTTINKIIANYMVTHGSVDNLVLFFPDEGAMKRYSYAAIDTGLPYCFGIKRRDWKTGNIEGLDIAGPTDKLSGKNVLIVDDICSKGGTFYHSAKALKTFNVNDIYLYVSHCEYSIREGELLKSNLIKTIFTTDTIYRPEENTRTKEEINKIIVLPINI